MLKFFLPHQEDFFQFFYQIADEMVEAAEQFQLMLKDLEHYEKYAKSISQHEEKADTLADSTLIKLHKTFITPFDRNDIHRFVIKLDDILDAINRTSKRLVIYRVQSVPEEIHSIAFLCVHGTETVRKAVKQLNNLKNSSKILALCDSINGLEAEAEQLLLKGVSRLFQEDIDDREVLKIKEIYEYSKSIIKNCQGASLIIKDVVLEYS